MRVDFFMDSLRTIYPAGREMQPRQQGDSPGGRPPLLFSVVRGLTTSTQRDL